MATEELLRCLQCFSDRVAVTAEQMFMVNTGEHWCHSVKTHDSNAKVTCLDCDWQGQLYQISAPKGE